MADPNSTGVSDPLQPQSTGTPSSGPQQMSGGMLTSSVGMGSGNMSLEHNSGPPSAGQPGQPLAPSEVPQGPVKLKLIQQQLVLLMHAHKCQQKEREASANGQHQECNLPHCSTLKNVLNHMTNCDTGRVCTFAHCDSSRQIILHWKNCWNRSNSDCPVCCPLKASGVNGDLPDLPELPPSELSGLDASHLPAPENARTAKEWHQRVTADLRKHMTLQLAKSIFPCPHLLAIHDQQIIDLIQYARKAEKDIFEYSKDREEYYYLLAEKIYKIKTELREKKARHEMSRRNGASNSQGEPSTVAVPPNRHGVETSGGEGNENLDPSSPTNSESDDIAAQVAPPDNAADTTKDWQHQVTAELRNYLVGKLVKAIFPSADPSAIHDQRIKDPIQFARKVEKDIFDSAKTQDEYHHLVAKKIYKIENDVKGKKDETTPPN